MGKDSEGDCTEVFEGVITPYVQITEENPEKYRD
jgi:hypothetical protein